MRIVAVTMVKDEADVIERTLWNIAAQGADEILIFDNESTDGTRGIIDRLARDSIGGCKVQVWTDWEVGYFQSRKMTELATFAGTERSAEWVWPFDADEFWTWPAGTIRDALLSTDANVVKATLVNHYETTDDAPAGHPFDRMQWREERPLGLPKVMFRWQPGAIVAPGNHAVHGTLQRKEVVDIGLLVHHYPYRSAEQFVRKARNGAAAYAATDLGPDTGRHWREYGAALDAHGAEALAAHYRAHFVYTTPAASGLIHDPAGWPDTLPPEYDRA